MEAKTCPHCNNQIPPEFAVMPVCTMCGGDLSAQPTNQQWASLDINEKKSHNCPSCQATLESVLITACPGCQAALEWVDGSPVVSTTAPTPPVAATPEPVAVLDQLPDDLPELPPEPVPEPIAQTPPPQPSPKEEPVKEGFFAKLLRMFGLKK